MTRTRTLDSRLILVLVALLATLLALLGLAKPAHAQNAKVEASAKALQKKAMEEDYLATDFQKAKDKLDKAISACGADKCGAPLRAQLKRDLGTVLVGGGLDKDAGVAAFAEAMKLDASVALDKDLKTKEIEAAWNEAKKGGGGGGGAAAAGGGGPAPVGDFVHTPIAIQQYRTPVPVYVEYAGTEKLVKVIARYRGLGMTEWKPVEMKRIGESGWGGLVPCADVQVGALSYYVQGFNAENDPVAVAGDRNNAYKVSIQREAIAGEAPHLPGEPPPKQCQDTGDCPPNFPGCKQVKKNDSSEDADGKDEGEECEDDTECKSRACEKKKGHSTGQCTSDAGRKMKRIWVGGMLSFDFTMIPSQDDVCKLHPKDTADKSTTDGGFPLNDVGYYCTADGSDYPAPRPAPNATTTSDTNAGNGLIELGKSNKVTGGAAPSNLRILATFDYAVNTNILLGARAGIVLLTYPGEYAGQDGKRSPVAPFHLEARGTYVFGKDPLAKEGLAPYAFFGAGVSTWETRVGVTVSEGTKGTRSADAWHLTGPGFFGIGGGVRYAFSPSAAFMGGLRAAFAFGNAFVPSFAPEVGVQFGF